ncbi:hypothetical protein RRG08_036023 [Elysia crispata]|uniref:Uncharacterized protein n=1 Tax=Elysia crispata TaxID=231223 RepID=A0AAE1ALH0_9GAST|nr:hypothetical protein RRG08_036023 [Elysia crispata]
MTELRSFARSNFRLAAALGVSSNHDDLLCLASPRSIQIKIQIRYYYHYHHMELRDCSMCLIRAACFDMCPASSLSTYGWYWCSLVGHSRPGQDPRTPRSCSVQTGSLRFPTDLWTTTGLKW